jgi:hypothetical protein
LLCELAWRLAVGDEPAVARLSGRLLNRVGERPWTDWYPFDPGRLLDIAGRHDSGLLLRLVDGMNADGTNAGGARTNARPVGRASAGRSADAEIDKDARARATYRLLQLVVASARDGQVTDVLRHLDRARAIAGELGNRIAEFRDVVVTAVPGNELADALLCTSPNPGWSDNAVAIWAADPGLPHARHHLALAATAKAVTATRAAMPRPASCGHPRTSAGTIWPPPTTGGRCLR